MLETNTTVSINFDMLTQLAYSSVCHDIANALSNQLQGVDNTGAGALLIHDLQGYIH